MQDITAQLDQLRAHMKNTAELAGAYYKDLTQAGCSPECATELVLSWHNKIWGGNKPN